MRRSISIILAMIALNAKAIAGGPGLQDGGFTYQGVLKQNGVRYNGTADLEFRLYDGPSGTGATQIGPALAASNQTITDGTSNTLLNFEQPPPAPPVWNGQERWLEVRVRTPAGSANPFVALTPWQKIATAPYAAYALNASLPSSYANAVNFTNAGNTFTGAHAGNGSGLTNLNAAALTGIVASVNIVGTYGNALSFTNTSNVFNGGGLNIDAGTLAVDPVNNRVGIGTSSPAAALHVTGAGSLTSQLLENTQVNGDARLRINSNGGVQTLEFRDTGDTNADAIIGIGGAGSESLALSCGSFTRMLIDNATGHIMLGFGAATGQTGEATLHVMDGSAGAITANVNSSLVLERNISNYLSMLTTDTNEAGILFGQSSQDVAGGILFNSDVADGLDFRTGGDTVRMAINNLGGVGIGTTGHSIDAVLHVQSDAARAIKVDRYTSDGELLAWARDDGVVGSVTVTGGVVAYGAFTGVHYAQLEDDAQVGELVSLTGSNVQLAGRADGETVYGVKTAKHANDPAVLGVYIGSLHGADYNHPRDLAQVAALGNGDLWIVDTGSPIEPGDYLIASDVPGCAMKDDPQRFAMGNIIARAASRVDWSDVPTGSDGNRRVRISVLFGNFVCGTPQGVADSNPDLQREVASLRAANAGLGAEVAGIRRELDRLLSERNQR